MIIKINGERKEINEENELFGFMSVKLLATPKSTMLEQLNEVSE